MAPAAPQGRVPLDLIVCRRSENPRGARDSPRNFPDGCTRVASFPESCTAETRRTLSSEHSGGFQSREWVKIGSTGADQPIHRPPPPLSGVTSPRSPC